MSYEEANHPPVIDDLAMPAAVKPGQTVELKASANDPDGDNIYYYWWHYHDPSGMDQPVKINQETSSKANFKVPAMANGMLYFILEVKDDGKPGLKTYRRLAFKVEN